MRGPREFFRKKKPWSEYKDLILDYYLEPYLAKVATLRRPILVVDCFAGPGTFDDGQPGSPLIISRRLEHIQERGAQVLGFYVERDDHLYERLMLNTEQSKIPVRVKRGDFRQHIDEILMLAQDRTVFVYLDPIKPSDLLFADMVSVYQQLGRGHSVEVLINFMSKGFLRAVRGLGRWILTEADTQGEHDQVRRWNDVAGGTYWQDVVFSGQMSDADRIEQLAKGYSEKLQQWFEWVIRYPIREKYSHKFPKYHLTFGSRHPDAIELMNRAMVKARREFVGAEFVEGLLFPNQPDGEVIRPCDIERVVTDVCRKFGSMRWKDLRVRSTIAYPCRYTDSEFNRAIKQAIQKGALCSDCRGERIEEKAWIWTA